MTTTLINKNQVGAGIYTQDNLIAGKDISLTDVSDIDSNTPKLYGSIGKCTCNLPTTSFILNTGDVIMALFLVSAHTCKVGINI